MGIFNFFIQIERDGNPVLHPRTKCTYHKTSSISECSFPKVPHFSDNNLVALFLNQDPFGEKRGRFDYQGLLARLSATHRRIREKSLAEDNHNDDDSDSDTSSSGTDPDSQGSSQPWLPGWCWTQSQAKNWRQRDLFCYVCSGGTKSQKRMQHLHLRL